MQFSVMRSGVLTPVVAFLALTLCPALGAPVSFGAEAWRGFRGLERQGIANSSESPIEWSRTENVAWKTPIQGAGHSSPVVCRDCLYVTTAYLATSYRVMELGLTVLAFGLMMLIIIQGGAGAIDACRLKRTGWQGYLHLFGVVSFMLAILAAGFLVFLGPGVIDCERCPIRGWLASCLLVSVCALLIDFRCPATSRWRLVTGFLWLSFGAFVIAAVPCKDHIFSSSSGAPIHVLLLISMLPFSIGAVGIVNWYLATTPRNQGDKISETIRWKRIVTWNLGVTATVCALAGYFGFYVLNLGTWVANLPPGERTFEGSSLSRGPLFMVYGLALVVVGCYLFAFALSGHLRPTGQENRISFWRFISRLTMVGCLVALSVLMAATIIWAIVEKCPLMAYYLGNPKWEPRLGWLGLRSIVGFASLVVAICLGTRVRRRMSWLLAPTTFTAVVLAMAAVLFFNDCWLRHKRELARVIMCLDKESGETRWVFECLHGPEGPLHRYNSAATPTPVVWGDHVFAYFGSMGVVCVDSYGKQKWTNTKICFRSVSGVGASPVVHDGVLVISNGMPKDPHICALDCDNGELLWRRKTKVHAGGNSRTPLVVDVKGRAIVLVWDASGFTGYDLHSGDAAIVHPIAPGGGDEVASLSADDDHIYCAGIRKVIALSKGRLGEPNPPIAWETRIHGPNCASPVLCNNLLFMVSDSGTASCLDAQTGRVLWKKHLKGKYYASPIAVGDRVYLCNTKGLVTVIAAAAPFTRIAENSLGEKTYATFAPIENDLFVRTAQHVWCIRSEPSPRIVGVRQRIAPVSLSP